MVRVKNKEKSSIELIAQIQRATQNEINQFSTFCYFFIFFWIFTKDLAKNALKLLEKVELVDSSGKLEKKFLPA